MLFYSLNNLGDLAEVKAGNVKCDIDGEKFVGIKSDGTPICTKYDTQNTHNSNCQLMGTRLFPYGRNLENSQYAVDSNAPKIGVNDPETINDLKINVRDYDYVEVGLISTIYTPSTSNPTGSLKKTGVSIHSNNVNTQRFAVKANSDHRLDIYSGFNSTNKGSINKYPLHIGKPHVSTKPEGNEAFVLDFDVHYGYYKTEGHYYIAYIRGYDLVCGTDHSGPNDKLKLFTPEEEDDSITCTSGHEWNSIERICEKSCPVGYQLHGEVCKNVCHHKYLKWNSYLNKCVTVCDEANGYYWSIANGRCQRCDQWGYKKYCWHSGYKITAGCAPSTYDIGIGVCWDQAPGSHCPSGESYSPYSSGNGCYEPCKGTSIPGYGCVTGGPSPSTSGSSRSGGGGGSSPSGVGGQR